MYSCQYLSVDLYIEATIDKKKNTFLVLSLLEILEKNRGGLL